MIAFIVTVMNNIFAIAWGSTAAIPINSWLLLIFVMLFLYLPLTLLGGLTARMKSNDLLPFLSEKYLKIPKELPRTRWFNSFPEQIFMAGVLPLT